MKGGREKRRAPPKEKKRKTPRNEKKHVAPQKEGGFSCGAHKKRRRHWEILLGGVFSTARVFTEGRPYL